jgi:hypothetical protein
MSGFDVLTALALLMAWGAAVPGADLAKIDRSIKKEPASELHD